MDHSPIKKMSNRRLTFKAETKRARVSLRILGAILLVLLVASAAFIYSQKKNVKNDKHYLDTAKKSIKVGTTGGSWGKNLQK